MRKFLNNSLSYNYSPTLFCIFWGKKTLEKKKWVGEELNIQKTFVTNKTYTTDKTDTVKILHALQNKKINTYNSKKRDFFYPNN